MSLYRPLTERQTQALEAGEVVYTCEQPGPICVLRDREGREGRGTSPREAFDQLEIAQLEAMLAY
jgi:hypothetical protein